MSYLWVSHTVAKRNPKTGKWDMEISLAWNRPFVKMSFDSEEDSRKFVSLRMKEMYKEGAKNKRITSR